MIAVAKLIVALEQIRQEFPDAGLDDFRDQGCAVVVQDSDGHTCAIGWFDWNGQTDLLEFRRAA